MNAVTITGPEQYIRGILDKYGARPGVAKEAARELGPFLRQWAGSHFREQRLSGSFAKGTATSLGTDVDVFISVDGGAGATMKAIYFSLLDYCARQGWRPRPQNVSIRMERDGQKIDLVPGRKQPGNTSDHTLYRREHNSWVQTNVATHVRVVGNSGRTAEIRALKIWRERHAVNFPSFYLELTVLEALKGRERGTLADNIRIALGYVAEKLERAWVTDPANTNNLVSDDLSAESKRVVAAAAQRSLAMRSWERVLW